MPTPAGVILRAEAQDAATARWTRVVDGPVGEVVERVWSVRWALPPGHSFPSSLVAHLSTNVSVEHGTRPGMSAEDVVVTGPPTRRFDVDLRGTGWVVGLKFHHGEFTGMTGVPARNLLDVRVPAERCLPQAFVLGVLGAATAGDEDEVVAACTRAVEPLLTGLDPGWTQARDLVRLAETDDTVTTTSALAERAGCSERTLQRLFARYVGPPPKQVVLRYRLQNAVAALDADSGEPLAELASRLGFYDQAHLAREFTAFVGIAPGAYRAGRAFRDAD
jgi:AraC-like DNA-binding protein